LTFVLSPFFWIPLESSGAVNGRSRLGGTLTVGRASRRAAVSIYDKIALVPRTGPPTVLFEVFWTQQKRERLIETALAGTDLPPEDYPLYVLIGAEGPWTPTGLAARLGMPLSTVIFRVKRIEQRGHAERVPNPDDGRSFLIRLTPKGKRLLDRARPAFRDHAEAVEARLGPKRVNALRTALVELRQAIDDELAGRKESAPLDRRVV
jgi:DNA-binding MarR family transcriptional regulator